MRHSRSFYRWMSFPLLSMLFLASACPDRNGGAGRAEPNASAIDRLALEVERADAVRAVKTLQRSYAQYAQFGLWSEMAALFAENARFIRNAETIEGQRAIGDYFLVKQGDGRQGLGDGEFHTQLVLRPLVNLSRDGQSAKGRWWEVSMFGQTGAGAGWEMGIYENEYVLEQGAWKISVMHYNPMFAGPYEQGWFNVDEDQKIVPYHFTSEETGIPVPEIPEEMAILSSGASAAEKLDVLERRISAMNDQDAVRNLQNAYGYYVDRKMWDDVTDLFSEDGVLEIADIGIYEGIKGIRRALEINGPPGLKHGQLHDHLQLDMTVSVDPGGEEAHARGLEFAMMGEADRNEAFMEVSVFVNSYVRRDGIWRIREMRIFPIRKTDYHLGWARSVITDPVPAGEHAPDRPVPQADVPIAGSIPFFPIPNPATGKGVGLPPGVRAIGKDRLLPPRPAAGRARPPRSSMDERIEEAQRQLAVSKAYDGTENVSSAYGDYLDDLDFGALAEIFAFNGVKQIPFSGFYVGRKSIARRKTVSGQKTPRARTYIALHLRTQPVILVAQDGRSSSIRTRLFQPVSSRTRAMGFSGGMYHDQAVLENGSWKLWNVAIDEHYFSSPDYRGGWSAAKDPQAGTPGLGAGTSSTGYPPDIPLSALGERQNGFQGGTGDPVVWPSILPMWFHYRNPVSGRVPDLYWRDCVTCAYAPETSMQNHGYLLPPD